MWRAPVLGCVYGVLTGAVPAPQIEELFARQAELEAQIQSLQRLVSEGQLTWVCDDENARVLQETTTFQLADAQATLAEHGLCLDYMWLLVCGAMVMFMQAGFSFLEAGNCRAKNAGMVLMKNVLDGLVGTVVWYFIGYGFAYGVPDENPNEFIGVTNFAGMGMDSAAHYRDWFFQWAFCATTATIVSGAVAERINFKGYIIYCIIMTGFIYPVIVYWTWSGSGFLSNMGYSDFAGSGIVHFTGGMGALVGAAILGPREMRWETESEHRFDPHNMSMVVLGTMILWFGWYGFNCGSTLAFSDAGTAKQAAFVAMNTTIAGSMGGLTIFTKRLYTGTKRLDLAGTCNGLLVGLVSVCAGVGDIEPHMAGLIGIVGACAHELGSATLKRLRVDDPCDAFAVHGCGGITGVLLRPLLDKTGPQGEMFGVHCLALVCIGAWSGGLSAVTFGILKKAKILRVDHWEEVHGADSECAQAMYRLRTTTEEKAEQAKMDKEEATEANAVEEDATQATRRCTPEDDRESPCRRHVESIEVTI